MSIMIVDDSVLGRILLRDILKENGYEDIVMAASAIEAIEYLKDCCQSQVSCNSKNNIDLILMDGIMPDIEGVEACRMIRNLNGMHDIPIIMVTGKTDIKTLEQAFEAGANDYLTKPFNKLELLARVRSAINLKLEIDKRKAREVELEELNKILQELSSIDGLTGIANRRRFDEVLEVEFKSAERNKNPLSIVMLDIDYFKEYNDTYGHLQGDECLKAIAEILSVTVKRPTDLVARYGGEEFVLVLPSTDTQGAVYVAELARKAIEELRIVNKNSKASSYVTVSLGVATKSKVLNTKSKLIKAADIALYDAKANGRNRIGISDIV